MPLDSSLNADIKRSHKHHCTITKHKPDNYRQFLSIATPKLIWRGIKRIIESEKEGILSSEGVIEDCDKELNSM